MPDEESYSVGYGKPPRNKQFRKGESGNPRGRPKGSKNVATALNQALSEKVAVNENGRRRKVTKLEAMAKQLANKGAAGDLRGAGLLLTVLQQIEIRRGALPDQPGEVTKDDQEIKERLLQRIRRMAQGGQDDGPDTP